MTSAGRDERDLVTSFVHDGFVRIDEAFPRDVADAGRAILWRDTGCDPGDPSTWTKPVIRLGLYDQEPFAAAATSPVLRDVFDRLAGRGRWLPRTSLGTFPVRFPSAVDPGDAAGTSTSASAIRRMTPPTFSPGAPT